MDFGLFLPLNDGNETLNYTLSSEKIGFKSVWMDDHLLNFQIPPENRLEAWTTISALSSKTSKIRLGNLVLCSSFRNPALLGKMVTSLDVISNGRIDFGIGAGWFKPEYLAYGFHFDSYDIRLKKLREGLLIMKKLFKEDHFNFEGEFWTLKGCSCNPKPIQDPVPIWVGGKANRHLKVREIHFITEMFIDSF